MDKNTTNININWYPGHMTKTKRMIEECMPNIDIVAELVDARIPMSSKNPDIDKLCENKTRLIILNKSDISDPNQNKKWTDYYKEKGFYTVLFNSKAPKSGFKMFTEIVNNIYREKLEKNLKRGIKSKSLKIMVLGIPNVGKSTFINNLSGAKRAKAEDRPGVTRGKQWISLSGGIDLLDMPGILWPRLEDQKAAQKLAITGAVKDEVLDVEALACVLAGILGENYENALKDRYELTGDLPSDCYELLELIGRKRGFIVRGGEVDMLRTSNILLDEFRACKIGKINLDIL